MRIIALVLALFFVSCHECEQPVIEDVWTAQELIADLVKDDYIVEVEGNDISIDGDIVAVGIIDLKTIRLPVVTCDPFGWGSEYDWLCIMTGTKGRALGKDAVTPTVADIGTYIESGSEMYPGDITSTTYFNGDTYVNQRDTDTNPSAFFGLTVAQFGPEWSPALEQWCFNDHIPFCIQE